MPDSFHDLILREASKASQTRHHKSKSQEERNKATSKAHITRLQNDESNDCFTPCSKERLGFFYSQHGERSVVGLGGSCRNG